jgi:dienelactone hydrolase
MRKLLRAGGEVTVSDKLALLKSHHAWLLPGIVAFGLAVAPAAQAAVPAQADCVGTFKSSGTGWKPGSSASSLPSTTPRPGPDVLYWRAPRAPQLENTGVWKAPPIMISGASAYRHGEFLYQDFIYDDTALTYPSDPAVYGGNAADLVELRVKPLAKALAVRLTYNTMLDPYVAATTIALGSSDAPRVMPHDAGASMPASVFVTVHGCSGDVVSAADGKTLPFTPTVSIDKLRRQVDIRVPYGAFDPRGHTAVRVGAATGLWDATKNQYQRPSSSKPAFFNVAFRLHEPLTGFRDSQQDAALSGGDLSQFFAEVDFTKLAAGVNDDMRNQSGGVPATGMMSRIYASHFETAQGRGSYNPVLLEAAYPGYQPCNAPCSPEYAGQLQPYDLYVPNRPAPQHWGLTLYHHGCSENYNSYIIRAARFADLDGGTSLGATNEARGECIWEFDQAGTDIFEVWADIARNYHLDPGRVTLSGQSLGGYATWKNAVQFPDLFSAAAPNIGAPSASADYPGPPAPPQSGEGTLVYNLLPSLRHVPVIHWVSMEDELVPFPGTKPISDMLDALKYRHSFRAFTGDHISTGLLLASYDPMGEYIANRRIERDPAHVTYVFSKFMNQPAYGLNSNHAYWLSGLALRDDSGAAPTGTIDVFSHGLGVGDSAAQSPSLSAGAYPTTVGGAPVPYYGDDLEWGPEPAASRSDTLEIKATNVSSVTVWVARAGLSCHPKIDVVSDGPLNVKLGGCGRTVASARR